MTSENMPDEGTADAQEVFEAGQESPAEAPFSYEEDEVNLVKTFKAHPEGRACLKRLSEKALTDFEAAWESLDGYRKRMAETWSLFSGTLEKKPPPLEKMANAHVPILMENTIRMVFRQAYELFGNWTNVFGVTPIGPDDEDTAKLLTLHGNWQIRKRIKDFKRQLGHRGLLIFDLFGDVICHSYWDPQRRYNRHEVLTANEFVCANAHVSTMPDLSDVSWVAKVIYMDAYELRKMALVWEDVVTTLQHMAPDWEDSVITRELRDAVDKNLGVDSTVAQKGQWRIIQYEGWLNLPPTTAKDANGEKIEPRDRYCKLILDFQTGTVLSLNIHERIDPFDKRRFQFQQQQAQQYQQQVQQKQQYMQTLELTRQAALAMAHSADPTGDGAAQGILQARQLEEQPEPPDPMMPDWMHGDPNAQPEPPASIPIRMFAHGVNIEPIQGILGLGTGQIHAAQNKAANTALSAFFDQASLGNFKQFLAKGDLRLPKGFNVEPGKIHTVEGAVNLQQDIMPLDFGQANPQLVELVNMLVGFGNTVSNTPEVLSGEAGKSGETAQGLAARIEQATKMLSVPTGKYADFLSQVLENNAALNAIFLDDSEFFSVNNHDPALGQVGLQTLNVGREMYDRPYDVEISADLKFTSTSQRITEADALVQMPNAVPELQTNFAFKYATVSKSLSARNRYDLVALLGQAPKPPPVYGEPTMPPASPPPPPGAPPPPGGPGAPANNNAQPPKPANQNAAPPKPPQQGAA